MTRMKLFLACVSSSSYLSENVVSLCLLDGDEAGVNVVIRT